MKNVYCTWHYSAELNRQGAKNAKNFNEVGAFFKLAFLRPVVDGWSMYLLGVLAVHFGCNHALSY
jgi:hypothetical protein